MILKRWVVVETGHWMTYDVRAVKYLATKEIEDGSNETRFEKERGFFGNERERVDYYSSGSHGPVLKNPVEHYKTLGWTLVKV